MNDWYHCRSGGSPHRHWGEFGAAGLFLVSNNQVLLQLRSAKSHGGEAWAIPGGALLKGESPIDAALRETAEEVGITLKVRDLELLGQYVYQCGRWTYTTIVAFTEQRLNPRVVNWESADVQWIPLTHVPELPLLPKFKSALPEILAVVGDLATAATSASLTPKASPPQ